MASGGMAELRAAEQKAAQIVQEARAGKEKCRRGGKREGGLCLLRVDSRPSCCCGGHPRTGICNHGCICRVHACRRHGIVGSRAKKLPRALVAGVERGIRPGRYLESPVA